MKLIWNSPSEFRLIRLPTRTTLPSSPSETASRTALSARNLVRIYSLVIFCPMYRSFSQKTLDIGGTPSEPSPATETVEIWISLRPLFLQKSIRFSTPCTLILSSTSSAAKCFTQAAQLMMVLNLYSENPVTCSFEVISPSTQIIRLSNSSLYGSSK